MPASPAADPPLPALGRAHARRLREVYRSAGWPCQDAIELELLAAGLLTRVGHAGGHETLRLTDAGIAFAARQVQGNRAALDPHERLVERVAREMARAGRIVWRGLQVRAQVEVPEAPARRWALARPDVFSIRNTSVAHYVEPVVHEVKVRRADLLGDLRRPAKRAAYLWLGQCWYVLGEDARGRPIAEPEEVPAECGVLMARGERLVLARAAGRPLREELPFEVWMALARATPEAAPEDAQGTLGADEPPAPPAA